MKTEILKNQKINKPHIYRCVIFNVLIYFKSEITAKALLYLINSISLKTSGNNNVANQR